MNKVFMAYDRWGGLITIVIGIYASLLAYGYLPRNPKDIQKLQWRKKFGGMMQILAPLIVLSGIVTLISGLSSEPSNPAAKRAFSKFIQANEARAARSKDLRSAELFLHDLQQIDLSEVPVELRIAMEDYSQALADGLASAKAGHQNSAADARMANARSRLQAMYAKQRP